MQSVAGQTTNSLKRHQQLIRTCTTILMVKHTYTHTAAISKGYSIQVSLRVGQISGGKWLKCLLIIRTFLVMNSSMNLGQVQYTLRKTVFYVNKHVGTGDIFHHPELLVPGVADVTNLAPAYEVVRHMRLQHIDCTPLSLFTVAQ